LFDKKVVRCVAVTVAGPVSIGPAHRIDGRGSLASMTDTLRPIEDQAPTAAAGPGVALPGLPGHHPVDPGEPTRSTPWALIIGAILATVLVAGFVGGGLLFLSAAGASAAAGGCGGG
jgi:hypothetical protein